MLKILLKSIASFLFFFLFSLSLKWIDVILTEENRIVVERSDFYIGLLGLILFILYAGKDYLSNLKRE